MAVAEKSPRKPSNWSEHEQSLLESAQFLERTEPFLWIEENLWILTKGPNLARLRLNTAQQVLYRRWRRAHAEGRPCRLAVPKARQEGVSTMASALAWEQFCRVPGTSVVVLAHKDPAARNLFRIPKRFLKRMKDPPLLDVDARSEMVAAPPLESAYSVMTAGSGDDLGKAYTIQFLHGSECANWTIDPDDAWASIANAVPDSAGTTIILESTCRGRDKFFYPIIQAALAGENTFEVVFLPWYIHGHEYSMTWEQYARMFHAKGVRLGDAFEPTEHELAIREKAKALKPAPGDEYLRATITDEQFVWRRFKLADSCKGSIDTWNRYYPTFLEDCWSFTEVNPFDAADIERYRKAAKPAKVQGTLVYSGKPEMLVRAHGPLYVWDEPHDDNEYVIGADVSEGLPGRDYSVAYVVNRTRLEIPAMIRGRLDPEDFADLLYSLGAWYNWCWLAAENVSSPDVARRLAYTLNYPKTWFNKDIAGNQKTVTRPGWTTNKRTRRLMIDLLQNYTKPGKLVVWDSGFPEEMVDFVLNERLNRYEAASGKYDDRLMALGVALGLLEALGGDKAPERPEEKTLTPNQKYERLANFMKWSDRVTRRTQKAEFRGPILG